MEYTVNQLAKLSGVSTRTLRYYHQIGLLAPVRTGANGYRIYGPAQVDLLQQILFFKELGFELDEIKKLVLDQDFDQQTALEGHLQALRLRAQRMEKLIATVEKTISTMKGEQTMHDNEKFEGFKQKLIDENEQKYGQEIRAKYGESTIDASNQKLKGMSPAQFQQMEALTQQVNETLRRGVEQGDPAGPLAQEACQLHRQWIEQCWPQGTCTQEAHLGLAQMYCADERFRKYYEEVAPGSAEFLARALEIYYQ